MESKKKGGGVEEKIVVSMLEPRVAKQCVGVILKNRRTFSTSVGYGTREERRRSTSRW